MKAKLLLLLTLCVFININTRAQKIQLKDGIIKVDNKDFLSYKETKNKFELTITKLNTENELIFLLFNDNQTSYTTDDDYLKINFIGLNLKLESSYAYAWKYVIKWFLENNLFDSTGNLNEDKIKLFIDKYNENLSGKKQ